MIKPSPSMVVFLTSMFAACSVEAVGVITFGQVQLEPSKTQDAFAAIAIASATSLIQRKQ